MTVFSLGRSLFIRDFKKQTVVSKKFEVGRIMIRHLPLIRPGLGAYPINIRLNTSLS